MRTNPLAGVQAREKQDRAGYYHSSSEVINEEYHWSGPISLLIKAIMLPFSNFYSSFCSVYVLLKFSSFFWQFVAIFLIDIHFRMALSMHAADTPELQHEQQQQGGDFSAADQPPQLQPQSTKRPARERKKVRFTDSNIFAQKFFSFFF